MACSSSLPTCLGATVCCLYYSGGPRPIRFRILLPGSPLDHRGPATLRLVLILPVCRAVGFPAYSVLLIWYEPFGGLRVHSSSRTGLGSTLHMIGMWLNLAMSAGFLISVFVVAVWRKRCRQQPLETIWQSVAKQKVSAMAQFCFGIASGGGGRGHELSTPLSTYERCCSRQFDQPDYLNPHCRRPCGWVAGTGEDVKGQPAEHWSRRARNTRPSTAASETGCHLSGSRAVWARWPTDASGTSWQTAALPDIRGTLVKAIP